MVKKTPLGRAMLLAIGRALSDQRAAGRRITDTDLAAAIGTSKNTIGRRLRGQGKLTADEFEALAEALDVPIDSLWARARHIQTEGDDPLSAERPRGA